MFWESLWGRERLVGFLSSGGWAGKVIYLEVKNDEVGQPPELGRDEARQVVVGEIKSSEAGKIGKSSGDGTGQVVVVEVEGGEACQGPELRRDIV
jgi:hypothetical protein